MSANLEYDEEDDLFVSDGQFNTAAPIAGPSDHVPITGPASLPSIGGTGGTGAHAGPSRTRHRDAQNGPTTMYPRLVAPTPTQRTAVLDAAGQEIVVDWKYTTALRAQRDREGEVWPERGVRSLKGMCVGICRAMYSEMRDIGSVPYALARDFLTQMPMEQLAEVEDNSPEIRKDTDWLWELFLLDDYPQFHASALIKKGVKRTSGWRRMYKLALEEARERQANAEVRLAERYKELEEEKERKKVKVLDRAPMGKMRKLGGGGVYAPSRPTPTIKSSGMFGKYRAESQRVNLALKRNAASKVNAFSHTHQPPAPSSVQTAATAPASYSSSRQTAPADHTNHIGRTEYQPPAGSRAPKPYRAPPLDIRRQEDDKARAALPAHLARATAENVAATKAGRSMGITDAAFTPTHDGMVPVKPGCTPAGPSTDVPPLTSFMAPSATGAAVPMRSAGTSSSFQPRRVAATTPRPSAAVDTSSASSRPAAGPSQPAISTARPPLTGNVPAKRPASRPAEEIIDVDALPSSSSTASPDTPAALAHRPTPPVSNFDQGQLESVLFRKKPRPGTSNLQKSR